MRKPVLIAALLACASMYGGGLCISSGPVRRGEWNNGFSNVVEAARTARLPMVMVLASDGCPHCARLEKAMSSEQFAAWCRNASLPMLFARTRRGDAGTEHIRAFAFGEENKDSGRYPLVCVWGIKADGTEIKHTFQGRRGKMSKVKDPSLAVELIAALDEALKKFSRPVQ